jgi:hypothetical protein
MLRIYLLIIDIIKIQDTLSKYMILYDLHVDCTYLIDQMNCTVFNIVNNSKLDIPWFILFVCLLHIITSLKIMWKNI